MATTTTWTTHIDRGPEDVFAYLSDIETHHEWSPKTYRAEKTSDGPIGVGTTYKTWGWLPGKPEHENHVTIMAYDPGKRFAFNALDPSGPVTIPSDFVLSAEAGGTRVDRTMTMPKPNGFQGVIWPVLFPMLVKPAIQKNLNMLKGKLEEHAA